jgi:hypothetical protein
MAYTRAAGFWNQGFVRAYTTRKSMAYKLKRDGQNPDHILILSIPHSLL